MVERVGGSGPLGPQPPKPTNATPTEPAVKPDGVSQRFGKTNDVQDVTRQQKALGELVGKDGKPFYDGPPDGKYGPKTAEAVKKFQQEHGVVPADGSMGPKTRAALNKAMAARQAAAAGPPEAPTPPPAPPGPAPTPAPPGQASDAAKLTGGKDPSKLTLGGPTTRNLTLETATGLQPALGDQAPLRTAVETLAGATDRLPSVTPGFVA